MSKQGTDNNSTRCGMRQRVSRSIEKIQTNPFRGRRHGLRKPHTETQRTKERESTHHDARDAAIIRDAKPAASVTDGASNAPQPSHEIFISTTGVGLGDCATCERERVFFFFERTRGPGSPTNTWTR